MRLSLLAAAGLLAGCALWRPLHSIDHFASPMGSPVEIGPGVAVECFTTSQNVTVYAVDVRCPEFTTVDHAVWQAAQVLGVEEKAAFYGQQVYWVRGSIKCGEGNLALGCTRGFVTLVSATAIDPEDRRWDDSFFGAWPKPVKWFRHELGHVARPELDCEAHESRKLFWRLELAVLKG